MPKPIIEMKRFRKCILHTTALLLISSPALMAAQNTAENPRLAVHGEAELLVPADQLQLDIGVIASAQTVEQAIAINGRQMQKIEKALLDIGLNKQEYQTSRFEIQPNWSSQPRDANTSWRSEIVGYTITNKFQIKTTRLDLAAKIIDAGSKAGANSIDSIVFDLSDPRKHKDKAIRVATQNAITDAKSLADSASVQLDRIISISLDEANSIPQYKNIYAPHARFAMGDAESTPIKAGDVTVRASVSLVYQLK